MDYKKHKKNKKESRNLVDIVQAQYSHKINPKFAKQLQDMDDMIDREGLDRDYYLKGLETMDKQIKSMSSEEKDKITYDHRNPMGFTNPESPYYGLHSATGYKNEMKLDELEGLKNHKVTMWVFHLVYQIWRETIIKDINGKKAIVHDTTSKGIKLSDWGTGTTYIDNKKRYLNGEISVKEMDELSSELVCVSPIPIEHGKNYPEQADVQRYSLLMTKEDLRKVKGTYQLIEHDKSFPCDWLDEHMEVCNIKREDWFKHSALLFEENTLARLEDEEFVEHFDEGWEYWWNMTRSNAFVLGRFFERFFNKANRPIAWDEDYDYKKPPEFPDPYSMPVPEGDDVSDEEWERRYEEMISDPETLKELMDKGIVKMIDIPEEDKETFKKMFDDDEKE